ncbi:MAG: hypothetical protein FWC47_08840 [Oscillospiraceae bacterium]|nr:hypothetical protein [Oscillospiraceae bacterium]
MEKVTRVEKEKMQAIIEKQQTEIKKQQMELNLLQMQNTFVTFVNNMFTNGMSVEDICKCTGLSRQEVERSLIKH